jgi:hypothetical protein
MFAKIVEWFDTGSEAVPYARKHAFGSSQGSFLFKSICQTVMIMLDRLVQVKVGLASPHRDIIFISLKMTGEAASADTVAVTHYIG